MVIPEDARSIDMVAEVVLLAGIKHVRTRVRVTRVARLTASENAATYVWFKILSDVDGEPISGRSTRLGRRTFIEAVERAAA